MADQPKRFFDVWFVEANKVFKEVPYHVVTDWVSVGKVLGTDRIKPSGTADWFQIGQVQTFQPYIPAPEPEPIEGVSVVDIPPVDIDFDWPKKPADEDDDVDMIPLIDISLVLLIFFMMSTTVAAISRIRVPDMSNAVTIESNPGTVRIDIDFRDDKTFYSIGLGTNAPTPEDDNLESDVEVMLRLDERLRVVTEPPKVRIAAHGDLRYDIVEEVLKALERRQEKGQISQYSVEVNERGDK